MNFYNMRLQFDRINRSLEDASFQDYRDDWLNMAWANMSEMFVIPSLKRQTTFDSVEDQQTYQFPYDYGGAEVFLWYKSSSSGNPKRLDPVPEDVLALMYERRSGNMGSVDYYDWTHPVGSDYASRTCTLANNSATVACAEAASGDADKWIRFDPFASGDDTLDPGDYGYLIASSSAGVSYTLDRAYRGPPGSTTGRIRPAEQQQFLTYGIPDSDVTDAFTLEYYAIPRRLYNDADVPEWPNVSLAVVYLAVSIGFDYIHANKDAATWFGRAMNKIGNLQKRREHSRTLIHDLTVGSVSGRRTGPPGVNFRRSFRR